MTKHMTVGDRRDRWQRGSLMVSALFLLVVLLGIGAAFMMLVTNELRLVERQCSSTSAFYVAEAGIEQALYDLWRDVQDDASAFPWMSGSINGIALDFSTAGGNYLQMYSDTDFFHGRYAVQIRRVSDDVVRIRSAGQVRGVTQALEANVRMEDLSPWNYAIFAGRGQGGNLINGNVDIRGSVLILGEGYDASGNFTRLQPTDYAVDLGGTAELVGNNYRTMLASLRERVPALGTTTYNGEVVQTLNGVLRVKNGLVGISGNSSVGEANLAGNAFKETVDGVYVNDGFGGNQGILQVFADEIAGYDLGDAMAFPRVSAPYEGYADYGAYIQDRAYVLTAGDIANINSLSSNFSFGNAQGSVTWNATTKKMSIDGIVYIGGNLSWTTQDIAYSGRATVYVTGDVYLGKNILTEASSGTPTFPDNILGIMTPNNMLLGGGAQLNIMGMFYAENQIKVDKQTNIVGTIVSNYFDMGTNVPKIYQVPEAARRLPLGMIGGDQRICRIVSWVKG